MSPRVHQEDPTKLKATVTQAEKDREVTGEVEVVQPNAADLNATVTQAAKDRTITGDVEVVQATADDLHSTVTPSGDMARKDYYDRNAADETGYWNASVAATSGGTVRWTYTVPGNKKCKLTVLWLRVVTAITDAGEVATSYVQTTPYGGSFQILAYLIHTDADGLVTTLTFPDEKFMFEGDKIEGKTTNSDSIAHVISNSQSIVEFDE